MQGIVFRALAESTSGSAEPVSIEPTYAAAKEKVEQLNGKRSDGEYVYHAKPCQSELSVRKIKTLPSNWSH